MVPGNYNITIYEGTNFNLSLTWKDDNGDPIDLTNWSAKMHIRNNTEDVAFLDCTPYFTLGGVAGTITLELPPTFIVDVGYNSGVYDIDMHHTSGRVERLLLGTVTIIDEVTRT